MAKTEQATDSRTKMRVTAARITSASAMIAYALAGVAFFADQTDIGNVFMILALLSFVLLFGTGVYRIAGGGKPQDEFEKAILYKASYYSYGILSVALLIGMMAYGILVRSGVMARFEDPLNYIIWGAVIAISAIPAACVAWLLPSSEISNEDDG